MNDGQGSTGDEPRAESIESFCLRISPRLVGSLVLQCENRLVAEEIAQEALARAWLRWKEVGAMASPEAWTYRVAFNLASSQRRRRAAERRAHNRGGSQSATDDHLAEDLAVRQAVQQLPARQRAAVVLRYFAGFSVRETAESMSCAEGTVRSLTSQGVAALRAALGQEDQMEEVP